MRLHQSRGGFTLIELSIVLVIIGLIVGGVLVGRDLIRTAELNSIITEYTKIQTAVNTFRGKYDCLPGDCVNATQFFGTEARGGGCPRDGNTTTWQASDGTCNGDGNGAIESYTVNTNNWNTNLEGYLFWQHLSLAGLWAGNYLGDFPSALPLHLTFGSNGNTPLTASGLGNMGWAIYNASSPWGQYYFNRNGLMLSNTTNLQTSGAGITPQDAKRIDIKIDDGLSLSSGKIFGGAVGAGQCVTDTTSGAYNLSVSSPVCSLIFSLPVE